MEGTTILFRHPRLVDTNHCSRALKPHLQQRRFVVNSRITSSQPAISSLALWCYSWMCAYGLASLPSSSGGALFDGSSDNAMSRRRFVLLAPVNGGAVE